MNKKLARKRKKKLAAVRNHRVLPDGRILSADGRENLLGNLAPVRKIPLLPWKRLVAMPSTDGIIEVKTAGETAWLYRLLRRVSNWHHDLLGFMPVGELDGEGFVEKAVGSVGVAVRVREIAEDGDGRATVRMHGVCRFEIAGFLPSHEDHFWITPRWFDDCRDADALVRPEFERCMNLMKTIAREFNDDPRLLEIARLPYVYEIAQFVSFMMPGGFTEWFSEEDNLEFFRTRSTGARLKNFNDRALEFYPEMAEEIMEAA